MGKTEPASLGCNPRPPQLLLWPVKRRSSFQHFFSCADGAKNNVSYAKCQKRRYQCKPPLFRDGIRCKISYGLFVDSLQSGRNFGERVLGIFSATTMATIFDFNGSDRLRREK